ncbi:MAG TPA: hypothetical protein PLJ60_20030 [Chryseolinea sp.]|nr:hypothetical protein [Chryseolinea sp.]
MRNFKSLFFLFFLLVFAFFGCDTKNEFKDLLKDYFIKFYGEDGDQYGVDLIVNQDGTMLLLGNTISADADRLSNIFLVMVNSEGNILWQKTLPGENETAVDIEPTLDNNFVILSNVFLRRNAVTGMNEYKIHLTKITPGGEVITDFEYNELESQYGNAITPVTDAYTPNGGFIVSGYTTDTDDAIIQDGVQLTDLISILVNSSIDQSVWTRRISTQLAGEIIKVFESKTYDSIKMVTDPSYDDRPFYVFGYSDDLVDSDDNESNLVCLTLTENGVWSNPFYSGTTGFQETMSQTIEANGSGFISVGTQTIAPNQKRLVIARSETDAGGLRFSGNSFKVVEGDRNMEAVSITQSPAGGRYLILANETHPTGTTNLWLTKVDIEGKVYWSASFGSITKNDFAGTVRELDNGKIVILGTVELESQNSKMALIKVNANGELLD